MAEKNSTRNFSFVALGQIVGTGLQAIFYFSLAALLDPENFGEMSYWISIAGTFALIARFGLAQTVTVYQAKNNHLLTGQANILAFITSGVAALILVPFDVFAAALSFTMSLFVMNQNNLLGLKKYKRYMWINIVKNILIVIAPISLYFVLDIPGILLGMAISNLLASSDYLRLLKFKLKSFAELTGKYKVLIHNFGLDASVNLPRMIDKVLIAPLFGFGFVGIHQFNIQILFALEILPITLYSFLLPEESSGQSHRKINYLVVIVSGLLALLVIVLAPLIIPQLFPKYVEGILPLQLMVISIIPMAISYILSAKLQAMESKTIGYSSIIRIGVLLGLIVLLGEQLGLIGLALAVLISISLNTIFLYLLYNKKQRQILS